MSTYTGLKIHFPEGRALFFYIHATQQNALTGQHETDVILKLN